MLTVMQLKKESCQPIKIEKAEKHYGGKYIGDFCLKTKDNGWSEVPAAVFYQPNPKLDLGHTHWFALLIENGQLFITNAESVFSEPFSAMIADNGEVIFSRYRHDFHTSEDESVSIDGGRDYTKTVGAQNRLCQLAIDKDKLVIVKESLDVSYISEMYFENKDIISEQDENGNTLFIKTCKVENVKAILFLFEHGADPHHKNAAGESALDILKSKLSPELRALLEKITLEKMIDETEKQSILGL